jgi:hypothetical protein
MTGYVNRHGWIGRDSVWCGVVVQSDDHRLCFDFFEDPNGGFGFEQFRPDPEYGGWTPMMISGYVVVRYASLRKAVERALN